MLNKSKSVFFLMVILFVQCQTSQQIQPHISANIPITSDYVNNSKMDKIIEPYAEGLDSVMNKVIGFCPMFLQKQKPSSTLGSMMADAVLYISEKEGYTVDFCILNYGGIRSTLDSGDITLGETFELMPFENQITILKISEDIAQDLRKHILKKGGEPMSSGFEILRGPTKNRPFYHVAINDYMANGGDGYQFLSNATQRWDTHIKIRDGLIEYIKTHNPLPLNFEKRAL
jgi:2',3'-cyclic-nucleotide 2'-phosphodiesterase (5'-nucleotidase family)